MTATDIELCCRGGMELDFSFIPPGRVRRPGVEWLVEAAATASPDRCLDWPFFASPYGRVSINGQSHRAHVVVCEAAHGPRPIDHQAAHACGRQICVNPHHLRWATPVENMADRVLHGTDIRGESNPGATLTVEQVRTIRALRAENVDTRTLSDQFGVSRSTIKRIVNWTLWGWLDAEEAA